MITMNWWLKIFTFIVSLFLRVRCLDSGQLGPLSEGHMSHQVFIQGHSLAWTLEGSAVRAPCFLVELSPWGLLDWGHLPYFHLFPWIQQGRKYLWKMEIAILHRLITCIQSHKSSPSYLSLDRLFLPQERALYNRVNTRWLDSWKASKSLYYTGSETRLYFELENSDTELNSIKKGSILSS